MSLCRACWVFVLSCAMFAQSERGTITGVIHDSSGAIISLYLMLYSAARFVVEFFRVHEQGNLWGGPFDTSQWISVVLVAIGGWYWIRARRRARITGLQTA